MSPIISIFRASRLSAPVDCSSIGNLAGTPSINSNDEYPLTEETLERNPCRTSCAPNNDERFEMNLIGETEVVSVVNSE
ncbi:hypothetical protein AYI68_g2948 [Smittium mucronatum]|uniref:Uncharacterized protein n=1 Tax=Smittium mucronatum TaxID=133383 RepID=A0A1R0H1B2_9FUNG|nr:hypothetical protein AYI68_g2948 [Smittium mucronatum]